jgi:hypothetical protein
MLVMRRTPLSEALAGLVLPVDADEHEAVEREVAGLLAGMGVQPEDMGAVVELWLERWRTAVDTGDFEAEPSEDLRQVISAALGHGDPAFWHSETDGYFSGHLRLAKQGMPFDDALALLSYVRLAVTLLSTEHMSYAQVAQVLSARRGGAAIHWKHVQRMTLSLTSAPTISLGDVEALANRDRVEGPERFADSSREDEIDLVASVASKLGCNPTISESLRAFVDPAPEPNLMVMLHFQASVAHYYDHPLTDAYEFRPRGEASDFVKGLHPSYEAGQSPFLNIAKGVSKLTGEGWAWGREDERKPLAMISVLEDLEEMAFGARREVASFIRQWLLRLEDRISSDRRYLSFLTSSKDIERMTNLLIAGNSATTGVFEQRMVDALTSLRHRSEDGWQSRGIGDSVFASNLSRRKVGDCEFIQAAEGRLVAYEPHGGVLADVYLEAHLHSLRAVVGARASDFRAIRDPHDWSLEVVFVAHDTGGVVSRDVAVGEFNVTLSCCTYQDLVSAVDPKAIADDTLLTLVNELVLSRLNSADTPQRVRAAVAEGAGLTWQD